jgi:5-methylcytosine-specific restriction endonuclease McrA
MTEKYICPSCNHQLREKYDGLVCINPDCKLRWKLGKGWVLRTGRDRWTENRVYISGFYNSNYRLYTAKQFAETKQKVLIRDDYTCQKCNTFKGGSNFVPPIQVHHIIPASIEMALYLDLDNLITLCTKCHNEIHALDKSSFSATKVVQ